MEEQHRATVPAMAVSRKKQAEDILTVMSERCTVKFCHPEGKVDTLKGRWCNECRSAFFCDSECQILTITMQD
jgi:hypothetical protein